MIFLTVGTQLPFDRLTRSVDAWCEMHPDQRVFGQIAEPGPENYRPSHFEWAPFVEPAEFDRRFQEADLIIAHAGMGSIITALTLAKPILILPRRADLREQRNDHQLATASRFSTRPGVHAAADESEVGSLLNRLCAAVQGGGPSSVNPAYAEDRLIAFLRDFIGSS